jgi:formylglycine-generating enzyme required for sulfatase activity
MKRNVIAAYGICLTVLFFISVFFISGSALCQDTTLKIPETVPVEAGSFYMGMDVKFDATSGATQTGPTPDGYTGATPLKESPAHQVTMSAFSIGKYEITNEEYAAFVDAGGYNNKEYWIIDEEYAEGPETGWKWKEREQIVAPSYTNYVTGDAESWDLTNDPYWQDLTYSSEATSPVVGVSWYEAYAYCKWLSEQTGQTYRLPTEAEWEYAGRGPQSNIFPWGNEYLSEAEFCGEPGSGARANCWLKEESQSAVAADYSFISTAMETGLEGDTVQVGSYPEGVSWCGAYDMAGNVMEWSADWFSMLYYPRCIVTGKTQDPPGPAMATPPFFIPIPPFWIAPCRTLRSIGFIQDPIGEDNYSPHPTYPLRCSHRQFVKRYGGTFYIGFRVLKEN